MGRFAWVLATTILGIAVIGGAVHPAAEAPGDPQPAAIRSALERALPALTNSAQTYAKRRDCFSCHNQTLPMAAVAAAGERGFAPPDGFLKAQIDFSLAWFARMPELANGRGVPGGSTTVGYALWAAQAANRAADDLTTKMVQFLLGRQEADGSWRVTANRPPLEVSQFTATALALVGLQAYAGTDQADEVKQRVERARRWLEIATPQTTEDAVFHLWGLRSAGASPEQIATAVEALRKLQQPDGGWRQTADLSSDAYATGQTLVVLARAGAVPTTDPAYRRGLDWLLQHQAADGTWHVATRSRPVQVYFESGFPYEKDQFISVTASGWATMALALALPDEKGQ